MQALSSLARLSRDGGYPDRDVIVGGKGHLGVDPDLQLAHQPHFQGSAYVVSLSLTCLERWLGDM